MTVTRVDPDPTGATAPRLPRAPQAGPPAPTRTKLRVLLGDWWARVCAYWGGDIDSPWNEAPASPAELVRYARAGAWCADDSIFLRFLGRTYCWLVAIPMSVRHYISAWIWQRPGRLFTVGLLVLVLRLSIGLSMLSVARYLIF